MRIPGYMPDGIMLRPIMPGIISDPSASGLASDWAGSGLFVWADALPMAPTAPSKASIVIVGSLNMDILTLLFEYCPPRVGAPLRIRCTPVSDIALDQTTCMVRVVEDGPIAFAPRH